MKSSFVPRLVVYLTALASIMLISGCSYTRALSADKFIEEAAAIQVESDTALLGLNEDFSRLSGEPEEVKQALENLATQRGEIETARSKIEALEAPAEAQPLKEDILALYGVGGGLISDLEAAGRYRLDTEGLTQEYDAASDNFSSAVAAATDTGALLQAVKLYAEQVRKTNATLKGIEAPGLYRRSHDGFVANLTALDAALAEMATGLASDNQVVIDSASAKLSDISSTNPGASAQAQAASEADFKYFNDKVAEMNRLIEGIRLRQVELREQFERE